MRIFHIATTAEWEAAQQAGSYTTSTYGVTLADEGFIHASRGDQWQGVRERFYGEVTDPLVLLEIDTDRLQAPVVEESPPGTDETFPHIYGPLNPDAVVQVVPLGGSFSRLFFAEMFHNLLLAGLVMTCVAMAALAGDVVDDTWGALVGTLVGLLVGVAAAAAVSRRRRARRPRRHIPSSR